MGDTMTTDEMFVKSPRLLEHTNIVNYSPDFPSALGKNK